MSARKDGWVVVWKLPEVYYANTPDTANPYRELATLYASFDDARERASGSTSLGNSPIRGAYVLRVGPQVCAEWALGGLERVVWASAPAEHPAATGHGKSPTP